MQTDYFLKHQRIIFIRQCMEFTALPYPDTQKSNSFFYFPIKLKSVLENEMKSGFCATVRDGSLSDGI